MAALRWFGCVVGAMVLAGLAFIDVSAKDVTVGGQVRPRFEFRDPVGNGYDVLTSMRVRAQVTAKLERNVDVLIQVQDVRLWGEESNTLGDFSADNFDLHQGYVTLNGINGSSVSARGGRQEIALGGQRLIGAVNWTQQGRAFDGVRVMAKPEWGSLDLLAIRLADATASGISANAYLLGAYATVQASGSTVDVFGLYNRISGGIDTGQYTLGARWAGQSGRVTYRAEGAYQTGERGGTDVSAFMGGGRVGFGFGKATVTIWYDYLSGDAVANDGKAKVFDTLFATNHKFYGYADLFLNIPVHTGGLGLQDMAVKFSAPLNEQAKLGVDLHSFFLAQQGTASGKHLGYEVDGTVSYSYSKQVTFVGGVSFVAAKDALADIGRLNENMTFAYVMTNVAF